MHLPGTSSLPRYTLERVTKVFAVGCFATFVGWSAANAQASGAQTSAPVPVNSRGPGTTSAQTGPVVLTGSVVDPDGAEIPGATLTLTSPSGKAYVVQSGSDGTYAFHGVPSGVYALTVTMNGFASFVRQGVRIGETAATLNAKLAVANQQTVVNVTTDENHVSVDQDSNASSTVLKGKDLDALSDDPDELSSELTALAGPSSGPNGGQIYIDGFTGGQLPPKSSIREIRINQNPFSAQYDQPGFGRVEIFTKPGTDKFRLYAQVNGNTKQFNTGSPFTDNATQPGYHQVFGFGQFSGPLSKTASFTVGGSIRQIESNSIVDPPAVFSVTGSPSQLCLPGGTAQNCTLYQTSAGNGFSLAQSVPQLRWDIRPRVDLALGEKNTLTAAFQYEHNNLQQQGIGGSALPSVGYDNLNSETELQMSDSQIISDKVINETRFEYQREASTTTPYSNLAQISVQGAFTGNGYGGGITNDTENHIEVQNYTSIALAKNFIRLGGRLRYTGETNTSQAGSTGFFTYTSICDYADTAAACGQTTPPTAPNLSSFSIEQIAHPTVTASTADLGLYAETDWKIKPTWTFSYGVRYETQNFIHDHNDWAPRLSTAYGIGKRTVLRAGFGLFYDRFGLGNQLNTIRNNGTNQQDYTLTSTNAAASSIASCSPTNAIGTNPSDPYGCDISASRLTVATIAPTLRAPYRIQENLGFDEQLFKNATASVNYQHIRGVHQFNSDVPNYTATAGESLDDQYQSEGFFNQNQLIVNVNVRNFHNGTFGGFYSLNFANSDTGGISSFASTPNDLRADYGRASFDVRNRLFLYGSFTLPHLVQIGPFIAVNSGSPYNITSGLDEFGDNQFNTRAYLATPGTAAIPTGYVKTIAGCGTFATPGTPGATTLAPINACTGPANVSVNVRLTKTFGFGPTITPVAGQGEHGGGPGGGPPGGGGHGGGGRGGPGGPPSGANSGKRYNLAIGVQAQNLFNDANLSTPVGTLSSPSFGTSTSVAGFPFAAGSALRRFQFQATFSF
jgi:hypothetical protein